jgi:endonuclease-3
MISKQNRIKEIKRLLIRDYPIVMTPLRHSSAFQLLVATVLSAQTLDESVNKVTIKLFEQYPDACSLSTANINEVDSIINRINYHKTKSKNIVLLAQKLINDFDGYVPCRIEDLIKLPGVGRKTANVVISEWFSKPLNRRGNVLGIVLPQNFTESSFVDPKDIPEKESIFVEPQGFVVDTHVKRVSNRLGLTKHTDPIKIEQDLMKIFDRNEWPEMSLRLIFHGRYRCKARGCECSKDENWKKLCKSM